MSKFPHFKQYDAKDCGPTCIKIIANYYDKSISLQHIRKLSETNRKGSSLLGLSEAVEKLGFRSIGVKVNLEKLLEVPLPCILHWNKNHYVVLYKTKSQSSVFPKGRSQKNSLSFFVSDPAHGLLKYNKDEFIKHWIGNNATEHTEEGIALLLEPTPKFYSSEFDAKEQKFGFSFLSKYLFKYKQFLWQLVIGLIAASLLQLIFPFLTQSVVDVGIKNQDIHFIYLILFAQLALFIGRTSTKFLLHFQVVCLQTGLCLHW